MSMAWRQDQMVDEGAPYTMRHIQALEQMFYGALRHAVAKRPPDHGPGVSPERTAGS